MDDSSAAKVCTRCGILKPNEEFYADSAHSTGRKSACRACMAAAQRARREADPEAAYAIERRYDRKHPERARAHTAKYRAANRDAVRNRQQAYRARLHGVEVSEVDRAAVVARDQATCYLCGHEIDPTIEWPHPRSLTLDHIIPLSGGGSHAMDNLAVACLVCNQRKGRR